ncbi:MAG: DDE-type integrase/transposase/recombinase [Actinobacteria bacterium]|nr:DDE-type integrase/transposase/recombinase [Actinomycetota bacterium]
MPKQAGEEIALFRYSLIRPLLDEEIEGAVFSARLKAIAESHHEHPSGKRRKVSRRTVSRWIDAYRREGFSGLFPKERSDIGQPRALAGDILDIAEKLKREAPKRSSGQIAAIIEKTKGISVSERTVRRHLARRGATTGELIGGSRRSYVRFERERPNELWIGDALHGPHLADPKNPERKRKTHLFCFIDDHARLVPHGEFFYDETLPRLERTLRVAMEKRGLPSAIYVDNGAVFVSNQFDRICARLGIKRILATPGEPAGRGKIERFFRTVRSQFLVEVQTEGVATLAELNSSFIAWLEVVYHNRVHSETEETPLERFTSDFTPKVADPASLAQAFLWEEERLVSKTACLSLEGNRYEVDSHLVGRKVNLRFDPFDLSRIEVFYRDKSFGQAKPFTLKRSAHSKARKDEEEAPPLKSGIDYLKALRDEHVASLAQEIPYRKATENDKEKR